MVFENSYIQTLNSIDYDSIITRKYEDGRGKAWMQIPDLVNLFTTQLNANLSAAIDTMNASTTDMDTIDLDYSAAFQDENGNPLTTDFGQDLQAAYLKGTPVSTAFRGKDYYKQYAEQMVDNMKSQFLKKAMAMCEANGVEFDNAIFETMFNNSKTSAVSNAVTDNGSMISIFKPKLLLDTVTVTFQQTYTAWVDSEKANKK